MTVERQHGKVVFICDVQRSSKCEAELATGRDAFIAALMDMRAAGWESCKMTGTHEYMHWCQHCPRPR